MRLSAKRFAAPILLVLLVGSLPAGAQVIYTAQGFELAGGFSTTGAAKFGDSDPADLYGQGSTTPWVTTVNPPSSPYNGHGVAADVETSITNGGSQAVSLTRLFSSIDTRWTPYSLYLNPYQPLAQGAPIVNIDWDMNIASAGNNTVFGIELNDQGGAGNGRIAYAGVDTAGNIVDDHAGDITAVPLQSVSTNTWHHFELQANFVTDTYSLFVDNSAVPTDTYAFENLGITAFSSAALVSYSENGGAGATGVAYYDNYVITAVPEPSAMGVLMLASGTCLILRRRPSTVASAERKLGSASVL